METETITVSSNTSVSMKSVETISILVVDDDTTCLAILATILKKFPYEVVTVKHPNDALYTLRIKGGAFDLVVSDVHMPDMNGFELQQAISQEFSTLPVVLMSADREEGIVLRGLESGAAYFLSKPISANDIKNLWQFAYMKKKSKVVIEETGSFSEAKNSSSDDDNNNSDPKAIFSSSSFVEVNGDTHNKDSKRKSPINEGSDEKTGESSNSGKQKKQKLVWTNSLHDRFLEAIRTLGLEKAVPKKILEFMKVPGLTRANVASHLQKYRIFLRRVTDTTLRIQYPADNEAFTSSFTFGTTSSILMHLNRLTRIHNQTSSATNLFPQSGFGQSRLLSNTRSLLIPNIGNTSQIDRASVRLTNNKYATSGLIQGNLSNIPLENSSGALSASLHASLLGSTQANSVGLKISNILPHLVGSGLPDDTINFQNLNSVNGVPTANGDNIVNLDLFTKQFKAASSASSFVMPGTTSGRDMLSDVIAEYQTLLPSNLPLFGNVENGAEETCVSPYTPIFDFTEFSIDQQSLEDCDLNSTFADQVNIQNSIQQHGCESVTMSGFYGGTSHWDNHVTPSSDQTSNQCDDEDFLEYLFAPSPFPEDHSSCE